MESDVHSLRDSLLRKERRRWPRNIIKKELLKEEIIYDTIYDYQRFQEMPRDK